MAWDEEGTRRENQSLLARYPKPRKSKMVGEDGGIYTAEMGAPPQDIDMGSSPKPKVIKKVTGGSVTRGDGCCSKGHTKGKVM